MGGKGSQLVASCVRKPTQPLRYAMVHDFVCLTLLNRFVDSYVAILDGPSSWFPDGLTVVEFFALRSEPRVGGSMGLVPLPFRSHFENFNSLVSRRVLGYSRLFVRGEGGCWDGEIKFGGDE